MKREQFHRRQARDSLLLGLALVTQGPSDTVIWSHLAFPAKHDLNHLYLCLALILSITCAGPSAWFSVTLKGLSHGLRTLKSLASIFQIRRL